MLSDGPYDLDQLGRKAMAATAERPGGLGSAGFMF
jgi:hypothetical protein